MSYSSLLIHACDIKRFTEGIPPDAYGNPVLTWATLATDTPCRLTTSSGRELKVGAELVIADYKLFLENVDITEQDVVSIDSKDYEVLLIENYADDRTTGYPYIYPFLYAEYATTHHKQCWLRISR